MAAKTYIATQRVYLSKEGQMVEPGEEFTTDAPKGETWEEVKPAKGAKPDADKAEG